MVRAGPAADDGAGLPFEDRRGDLGTAHTCGSGGRIRAGHPVADTIEHVLGIRVQVTLVEPNTIQRSEGKAKRVIDRRAEP